MVTTSSKGITLEFYAAMIGCLLLHLHTGMAVNKYMPFVMGQVACGQLSEEKAMVMLQRIAREKMLEKARLLRKKLAAKSV